LTPKLYGWRLNKSMRYTWIHAINEPRNFSNKYNIGSMENDNIGGVGFSLHCMSIELIHDWHLHT
jgi:hypothetical protein